MSTMAHTKRKRTRRSFTDEFRARAVRLVFEEGKTVAAAARDLDLTESSFRNWVEQARADAGRGKPGALTSAERATHLLEDGYDIRTVQELLGHADVSTTMICVTPAVM